VTRFLLGLHVPFGFGALFIELAMLTALLHLHHAGHLSPGDLGLRAAPAARSVGLCLLALIAYFVFEFVCFATFGRPKTSSVFAGIANRSTLVIAVTGFTAAVGAPVVEEMSSVASAFESALTGQITVTFYAFLLLALGLLTRAGVVVVRRRVTRRGLPAG
jgi:hypothetical protein